MRPEATLPMWTKSYIQGVASSLTYLAGACVYLGETVFSLLLSSDHSFDKARMIGAQVDKACFHTSL